MSTITAPAPERADAPNKIKRKRQPNLYSRYFGAMLYFMGAALIAGGVVHYPIDPLQYAVICAVGAFVFLLGTIVNEFVLAPERPRIGRATALVTFSLLLSFGVGMVGGGIQHFTQFPERSAVMTPVGILMSYAAFVAKDSEGRLRHVLSWFAVGVVAVAGLTWLGMSFLAQNIDSTGHSHPTSDSHQTSDVPADAPADAPVDTPAEATMPAGDGHNHTH